MNNWIIILFSLLLAHVSVAQNDTINKTDATGTKQGYWVKNYDNGAKKAEGFFKNGKQVGQFKHYYSSGKIQTIIKHRVNSDTSDAVYYHVNGKKLGEGIYIGEQKEGLWLFYDDLGELSTAEIYSNGLRNGKSKTFYLNQKLAKELTFKNDTMVGAYKEYFENGKVKEEGTYKKGKKHKEVKMYYPAGTIKTIGNYALGKRHNKWVYYAENGKITAQEMYRYSKLLKQTLSEEAQKQKEEHQKELDKRDGDFIPEDSIDE